MNKTNTLKGALNMKRVLSILVLCVMISSVAYANKVEDSGKVTSGYDDKGDPAEVKVYRVIQDQVKEVTLGQLKVEKATLEKEIAQLQSKLADVDKNISDADKIEKGK